METQCDDPEQRQDGEEEEHRVFKETNESDEFGEREEESGEEETRQA